MDSLHAIGFYVSSGISLAGGLGVALLPGREWRGAALAATAVGVAGIDLSLSAGFTATVVLICYLGCAFVLAGPMYRVLAPAVTPVWPQLGAVAAAALFAVLAYSAFKGAYPNATFYGGAFDTAAIGRLLFAHDAMPVEAIAALVLVAIAGSTAAWRIRTERTR